MIDLCAVCLAVITDERIPTKLYPHGTLVNTITHVTAENIMRSLTSVVMVDGTILPMVAISTVNGTRVCARHSKERLWE